MNTLRYWLLVSCAPIVVIAENPAIAQTIPRSQTGSSSMPDSEVERANETDFGDQPLPDEIVVTAERRAQRLEEVPASVTAISEQQLTASGVTRFMDVAQIASGVQIQKNGYTTQPSVRGITSLTTGFGFENNVAVYIDGYYQPDSVAINTDLVNVSQIEILKGPQGTLYGRNATGGAILINTLEPSEQLTGKIQAGYASYDERSLQGYLSGRLNNLAAFSVAGSYRRSDGYIRDLGTDGRGTGGYNSTPTKNDSLRAKLKLDPASWLSVTAGYNYAKVLDAIGLAYTIYAHPSPILPQPPLRATKRDTVTNNGRPDNTAMLNEATIKTDIKPGVGDLTLRTSWSDRKTRISYDFDGSKADIFRGIIPATQRTFQQSIDYSVDPIKNLDLLVGGLYFNDRIYITGQQAFNGGRLATTDFTALRGEAISAYIDATYRLGAVSLTGGLRYSHEHKEVAYSQIAANPVPSAAREANFSATTPRAIVRYEVAPRTNVYASFSQGFRTGVFQNQVLPNPNLVRPIEPERISAYEVGFKTARPGFQFNTAAFYYDYSQLQVGVVIPNPITGIGVISTIINAKAAEVYGADAQANWTPVAGLNLTGSFTYIHARYTDFRNATATGLNAATNLNVTNQAQDWSGKEMARAPATSATLQGDYSFALAGGTARVALNGTYTASYVVNNPSLFGPLAGQALANVQRYRQGAYGIGNAQVSWTDPSDHFTLTGFVNNFTDTRFQLVTSGGAFGDYRQFSVPLVAGGRIGFKF